METTNDSLLAAIDSGSLENILNGGNLIRPLTWNTDSSARTVPTDGLRPLEMPVGQSPCHIFIVILPGNTAVHIHFPARF